MKKKYFIVLFVCASISCFSQKKPADSLQGMYAGISYLKTSPYLPWSSGIDTFYMNNIDSINCMIYSTDVSGFHNGNGYYYSDYYSCNGVSPSNSYMKFYSGDSVRIIEDSIPQPPPTQPIWRRFFGRRINNKVTGIENIQKANTFSVSPNPTSGVFNVQMSKYENAQINIYDVLGACVYQHMGTSANFQIDLSAAKSGIYFLQLKTSEGVAVKKVVVSK